MYQVSEAYKTDIRKTIRNLSYIKIIFGITDPDADTEAVISNNGQMPWSENPEVEDLRAVENTYATLELNRWVLDGTQLIFPENAPHKYQAFVSDKVSNEGGTLLTSTVLTVTFATGQYSFSGLSFTFDSITKEYPTEVNVKGYLDDVLVYENTKSVDSVNYEYNEKIPGADNFVNKLVISFTKTVLPYRRVRVEDLVLGLRKIITSDGLISSTWKRTNDLMNTVLPDESFSFTFFDPNKDYNPDNPEGLWKYIETGQQVRFSYGYQLEDGSIEWIPGSRYITDGGATIEDGNTLPQVTFNTISQIQALNDIYDEGVYNAIGATFYDLADNLLYWAGVHDIHGTKKYILDESLKNYIMYKPLPVLPVKELLQLIANEGMCLLFTDRQGYINIVPRKTEISNFAFTFDDILTNAPDINKYPFLKNLYVSYSSVQPESEVTELVTIDIENASKELYTIEYSAATSITASAGSGVTIDEIVGLYAYRAKLKLTGTGKVTISGKKLTSSDYVISKQFNVDGDDCTLETKLLEAKAHAMNYINWMGEILVKRNDYTFADRGFPEIDICDIIGVDTAYTENRQVNIVGTEITFDGGLSGESEVLG